MGLLNFYNMKELKIEIPEGYEIDTFDKQFGKISFRKKEKHRPLKVEELTERNLFLNKDGSMSFHSSTEEATAFTALKQLKGFADAWNELENFKPDFKDGSSVKYSIEVVNNTLQISHTWTRNRMLVFKSKQTAADFLVHFTDLLEVAKPLI